MSYQKLVKKKKLSEILLFIDYNTLERSEVLKTIEEIQKKLISIFSNHIGKENSISSSELFKEIFSVEPAKVNVYKRAYWWNVIKKVISELRKYEIVFIVNQGHKLYVLQSLEELKEVSNQIDKSIEGLKLSKIKAQDWVKEKKWKKLLE
jgi:hypothetical protein